MYRHGLYWGCYCEGVPGWGGAGDAPSRCFWQVGTGEGQVTICLLIGMTLLSALPLMMLSSFRSHDSRANCFSLL